MFGKYHKLYLETIGKLDDSYDRAYNLNLYLYWLENNYPYVFNAMNNYFNGMPGYTGNKQIKDELPLAFFGKD